MNGKYWLKFTTTLVVFAMIAIFATGCGTSANEQSESGEETASKETKQLNVEKNPIVTITMSNDEEIKVELYPNVAPNTVVNFVSLVENGFYDGLIFHRVIPKFMIQGGDPEGTGAGGPGYQIKGEFSSNGYENNLKHERGVISMARSRNPDSAGSQFFIMVEDATHLDGEYAAFGKVIEGMETVDHIVAVPTDTGDKPLEDQVIKKMTVETFDFDYGLPEKVE